MEWDALNDEQLGRVVDAWLKALRAQGLSDWRVRELAGMLGTTMSRSGYSRC